MLHLLQSGLVASLALPSVAFAAAKKDKRPIALLVPLTGQHARLGTSMQQAVLLAENRAFVQTFDTGGDATGAAAAAARALRIKPALILGPLTAAEIPGVKLVVGPRAPVISFSNSADLRAPNFWIFGITAAQVTTAVLRYARTRGVKSVLVINDGTEWSEAASAAAQRVEAELGMTVRSVAVRPGGPAPNPGDAPDAILLPGSSEANLAAARHVRDSGVQVLGTFQGLDHRPSSLEALEGAWIASPDPASFGTFAAEFSARNGDGAGAITALAYDAAGIANQLRQNTQLNAEGLLNNNGFQGVMGPVRFRTDGSVARDFAILVARADGYETVAVSSGS